MDKNKIVLVIGHNASRFNNHIKIVEAFLKLSDKDRFLLIFPFTYGADSEEKKTYKNELIQLLKNSELDYRFLEDFMDWPTLAQLRKRGDIMIHLPESDALSGAITEAMYSGNVVLTGSWLPYSPFRQAGLVYYTVNDFSDLTNQVEIISSSLDEFKKQCSQNPEYIREHFFPRPTAEGWLAMFKDI